MNFKTIDELLDARTVLENAPNAGDDVRFLLVLSQSQVIDGRVVTQANSIVLDKLDGVDQLVADLKHRSTNANYSATLLTILANRSTDPTVVDDLLANG